MLCLKMCELEKYASSLIGVEKVGLAPDIPTETLILARQAFMIWDIWTDPECYTETGLTWMNKYFYSLHNPEIYNAYAEYLGSQKKALNQIEQFCSYLEGELKGDPRQIIPSMIAYCLLGNPKLLSKLEVFEKNYPEKLKLYFSDSVCKRSVCRLNLNHKQFHNYCVLYGVIKNSKVDINMKTQFLQILEQEYPQINLYVKDYIARCDNKSLADALFTPFLYGWIRSYYKKMENSQLNEVISVLYLFVSYNECHFYGKEINLIYCLLYRIYSNPKLSHHQKFSSKFRKRLENSIHNKMNGSLYQNMTFLNFLNDLVISENYYQLRSESLSILMELWKCKQTEIDNLLSEYYGYLYYKSMLLEGSSLSIEAFDQELIDSALIFLQYDQQQKEAAQKLSVTEQRKMHENAEKWKDFFFYAQSWLNRKDWEAKEESSVNRLDVVYVPSDETVDRLKEERILSLQQELDALKKNAQDVKLLHATISELQKEKRTLQKTIEDAEKDRKELISLRNYIYTENIMEEETGSQPDLLVAADFLDKNIKGVVVGGHPNFHNKLSKYLSVWKMYCPKARIPSECINSADIVVIYTDHIDHSTYLNVISEVRKSSCKLLYIHNVNIESIILKVYAECGGKSK